MENEKKYLKNINYQLSQISQGINKLCKILEAQNGVKKEKLISKTQSNKKVQTPKDPVVEKTTNPLEVDNLLNDFTMVPIEHEVEDVSDEHSEIKVFLDDLHNDNSVTDDVVVLSEDNNQHLDHVYEDVIEEIVVTEEIVEDNSVSDEFAEAINVEEAVLNDDGVIDEHTEKVVEDVSNIDEKQIVSVNEEEKEDINVAQQPSAPEYDAEDIDYTAPEYRVEEASNAEFKSVVEDVIQNDEAVSNIVDTEPSRVETSSVSHSLKFCPECGYKFEAGMPTKFCPECGYRLQNKSENTDNVAVVCPANNVSLNENIANSQPDTVSHTPDVQETRLEAPKEWAYFEDKIKLVVEALSEEGEVRCDVPKRNIAKLAVQMQDTENGNTNTVAAVYQKLNDSRYYGISAFDNKEVELGKFNNIQAAVMDFEKILMRLDYEYNKKS